MLKIFLRITGGLLALCVFIMLALATPLGKDCLKNILHQYIHIPDVDFRIQKIQSFFPLKIQFKYIRLKKGGASPWVKIEKAHLRADIGAYLSDQIARGQISIQTLHLLSKSWGETDAEFSDGQGLMIPCDVYLETQINNIYISEKVAGRDVRASHLRWTLDYVKDTEEFDSHVTLKSPVPIGIHVQGVGKDFESHFDLKASEMRLYNQDFQDVSLQGQLTHLPYRGKGEVQLSFTHNQVKNNLTVPITRFAFPDIELKDITFQGFHSVLSGDLRFHEGGWASELRLTHVDLKSWGEILGIKAQGSINGTLTLDPTPGVSFHLTGKDIVYEDLSMGHITSRGTLKGWGPSHSGVGLLAADGQIDAHKAVFKGTSLGNIHLMGELKDGQGPFSLHSSGEDVSVNLETWVKMTPLKKIVTVRTLDADFRKTSMTLQAPFTILWTGDQWHLEKAQIKILKDIFQCQGSIKGKKVDFSAQGNLNLGPLLSPLTEDDVQGILNMDIQVSGLVTAPILTGKVELQKGYYESFDYGTRLHDIAFTFGFDEDTITLVEGTAHGPEKGSLNLKGTFYIPDQFMDVSMKLQNLKAVHLDSMQIQVDSGNLYLKGALDQLRLFGDMNLGRSKYDIGQQFRSEMPELNIKNQTKDTQASEESNLPVSIRSTDVNLNFISPLHVSGMGLESHWTGAVKLGGEGFATTLKGPLKLRKGNGKFLGVPYKITEGQVLFDDDERGPFLNLKAEMIKNDFKAFIHVLGRANKPQIILSSEPALPQSEILARILFSKGVNNLSALEAVRLAHAVTMMNRGGAGEGLFDSLGNELGLDNISFESGENYQQGAVKLEKRLVENVNLSYFQGISPEDSKFLVEFEITPNVNLAAELGASQSSEGISINYKWDY